MSCRPEGRSSFQGIVGVWVIVILVFFVWDFSPEAASKGITVTCFDSGTRVVREVAEALTGRGESILECYPAGSELFLWFLHLFPEGLRTAGIEWGMSLSLGDSPGKLKDFAVSSLPEWCVSQYPAVDHGYSEIMIGSPNGGIGHLAALLRVPFLTSSFGLTIRHPRMNPDDVETYYKTGKSLTDEILGRPDGKSIEVINHYDPLHDRSLVKFTNFLRIKLLELPGSYQEFILKTLAPQGKIILINCSYKWPQYRLSERSYLQVGGLGAINPQEYLNRWPLRLPIEERRESEWGCPEEFAASVKNFAKEHGFRVIEIKFDLPQRYGLLAYRAYGACAGVRKDEVLFDCFNYQNPRTNIQTGIPGLWLPFNTEDSVAFIKGFLNNKKFKQLYLALVPSFAHSPDTAPIKDWKELLSSHGELEFLGIDPHAFPADTLAPFRFVKQMKQLRKQYQLTRPLELDLSTLEELLYSQNKSAESDP